MTSKIKKPIQVTILVSAFPNIVQTYTLNLIVYLKTRKMLSRVIAEIDPKQKEVHYKVKQFNLLDTVVYQSFSIRYFFRQIFHTPLFSIPYISRLSKIVTSAIWKEYNLKYIIKTIIRSNEESLFNTSVTHAHSLHIAYEYLFLKEIFDIPATMTFHGLEPTNSKMLADDKTKKVLDKIDIFFVNTRFAQDQLTSLGCSVCKIRIVPQGTDTKDFPYTPRCLSPEKVIRVLTVGRLSIEKGHAIALRAIARVSRTHPNIEYHIVGDGPERNNIESLISDLCLEDNIKLHGLVTNKELNILYSSAHIFVLPSIDLRDGFHVETQGVVLQEAQSSGLAVIASYTGGIPEVIQDFSTGLLFEENNESDLADKITLLIDNPEKYSEICISGRKAVEEKYNINIICEKLVSIYRELL